MTVELEIISSNPDYSGLWSKEDTEREIQEILGRKPKTETEWIEWIFGHMFDDAIFEDESVLDIIAKHDWITDIKLETQYYDKVHIIKR